MQKYLLSGLLVLIIACLAISGYMGTRNIPSSNYIELKPTYHMLVIRGYNSEGSFVNDPGTSSGKNQFYSFEQLKSAAVDWDSGTSKMINRRVAIEVWR